MFILQEWEDHPSRSGLASGGFAWPRPGRAQEQFSGMGCGGLAGHSVGSQILRCPRERILGLKMARAALKRTDTMGFGAPWL